MYREGNKLWFKDGTGSPIAGTLRLRYAPAVDDLSSDDASATYDYIPAEYLDMVVARATVDLLPAGTSSAMKWERRWGERLRQMREASSRTVHDGPARVQMVDDW
jgi:hypothetical protein